MSHLLSSEETYDHVHRRSNEPEGYAEVILSDSFQCQKKAQTRTSQARNGEQHEAHISTDEVRRTARLTRSGSELRS